MTLGLRQSPAGLQTAGWAVPEQTIPSPAHPNSTAHAGRNSLKSLPNRLPPFGAGIADDELDSEKMPETVPPPGVPPPGGPAADGARGDARVRHEIRRVRVVREEDDQDETRSLLPQTQSPFLDGSGPSTGYPPPSPPQSVRTGPCGPVSPAPIVTLDASRRQGDGERRA